MRNGCVFYFNMSQHQIMLNLLQVEKISQIFELDKKHITISFDNENKFMINKIPTLEDYDLINLLANGVRHAGVFLDANHETTINNDKVIKIIQKERTIIETSEGIQFYLYSVGPEVIIETYVRRIHDLYSHDLQDSVVIDAGAAVGDTPLYFASKGAKVYAFEMTKRNYDQMMENISLNPTLSNNIIPVRCAVGTNEKVEYYESDAYFDGGASFIVNKYGKNSKKDSVQGMTIETIINKYNIDKVKLLKLDCKGCEHLLTTDDLVKVQRVKIEYYSYMKSHDPKKLVDLLKQSKFDVLIYKNNPDDPGSLTNRGNIIAEKKIN